MEKDKYVYRSPLEQGYKQFKLTKKQHNELFLKRKKTWKNKFEYYYDDNGVLLDEFASALVTVLIVFAFPVFVLINGFMNTKKILREYKELFNQKKYGSYSSDYIPSETEKYDKIMKLIKGEK